MSMTGYFYSVVADSPVFALRQQPVVAFLHPDDVFVCANELLTCMCTSSHNMDSRTVSLPYGLSYASVKTQMIYSLSVNVLLTAIDTHAESTLRPKFLLAVIALHHLRQSGGIMRSLMRSQLCPTAAQLSAYPTIETIPFGCVVLPHMCRQQSFILLDLAAYRTSDRIIGIAGRMLRQMMVPQAYFVPQPFLAYVALYTFDGRVLRMHMIPHGSFCFEHSTACVAHTLRAIHVNIIEVRTILFGGD